MNKQIPGQLATQRVVTRFDYMYVTSFSSETQVFISFLEIHAQAGDVSPELWV